MPKSVEKAFTEILGNDEAAQTMLKQMKKTKRY